MFLENRNKTHNSVLNYLLGFFIIAVFYMLGQIPLAIAVVVKTLSSGKSMPTNEEEIMKIFSPNTTLFLMLLIFVSTMIGIVLVVKYLHKLKMIDITTSRDKVDWQRIFFSFSIWSSFTVLSTLAFYFSSPESFVLNFKLVPFLILLLISFTLLPIQTSAEEYIFRGYLMQGLGLLAKNRWFPLVTTSLMFGLMHILNPEVQKMGYIIMVYYIGTGFFLGIITLMDDGMELALGFHAANNITAALLVSSDWSALKTESIFKDISTPSVGFEVLAPVIIIFPILLIIFSKKYKWTNWKEKLTGKIVLHKPEITQNSESHE
ncbi:CPBP family intramembrane glutamic endopeptidase [Flavobacterium buctense]|uniref:CPBP family intramembrane glutamic endopeptidase n=1 Tax=Flavobacterium buctense TaxID=1648146 RepID=A0ABU9E0M6_9FLAO|nr:CPBP family intramembrane glutamic endopeptidase [Flavobacterium buctense]